ncbi:flagellar biosynthetic protein FliO [uncultured Agrobacterium sp.]|uniref:flagellar biosynthetic protein FliO n=1 Tax=uncultured Agrobacterium sp. TaxID=157277 RepID=UPI0026012AAE|nr:flagellar biosynthetic protein FliO [uncultured Agrobacterium sp.]
MEDFIGAYGNRLIIAVVGVGTALLLLAIVLWFIRRRSGSAPFIRGGRNRQPRLQVLDATAVDARRRLVLVRRDNVEHLVMIGGPTDIVIESGIGAIPFMKDVRDPQEDALITRDADRQRSIAQAPQDDIRPAAANMASEVKTPAADERKKPAAGAAPAKPAPSPSPAPAVAATRPTNPPPPVTAQPIPRKPDPAPLIPPVSTAGASAPSPHRPQPVAPPAPKALAREPVAPTISAAPPILAAAVMHQSEDPEPAATATSALSGGLEAPVVSPAPSVSTFGSPVASTSHGTSSAEPRWAVERLSDEKPEPVEHNGAAVTEKNAVDFLDASRNRVLPAYQAAPPVTAASAAPVTPVFVKQEPLAPSDNGPVFGDQLASDFENFLEAEIAKNNITSANFSPFPTVEPTINPDTTTPDPQPEPKFSEDPAAAERDVQKEMSRIFGEMSVTRDR